MNSIFIACSRIPGAIDVSMPEQIADNIRTVEVILEAFDIESGKLIPRNVARSSVIKYASEIVIQDDKAEIAPSSIKPTIQPLKH